MKKRGLLIVSFLVSLSIIITSCSTVKATETPVLQKTETAGIATKIPATSTPTLTPTPKPIPCEITFDTDRDGNWEIYKTSPDGTGTVNLTNNPGDDHAPVFSPDGDQIAFVSNRENGNEPGKFIYIMNSDGSNIRRLTHEENCEDPDWSHDGKLITYSNNGDIWIIPADGSGNSVKLRESPEEDMFPTWSPDSTKIAWIVDNKQGRNAYVMNADGSNVTQVGFNNRSYFVKWIPDGRLLTGWIWESKDELCQNCISNIDGTGIISAGGKGEIVNYLATWTMDGNRAELVDTDLITGNPDILLVSKYLPDTLNIGIGAINLSNSPANDRNPDAPINCGGGWTMDPEAAANGQPGETAASTPEPAEIFIGYTGDNQADWQRKNDFDKACGELGIKCAYGEISDLLKQKVSAIVLNSSPDNPQNTSPAINDALKMGIPVLVLDAEINLEGVYSVTVDHGDMIRATLDHLFKDSDGAGEFAYFDFSPTQQDAELIKGILEKEYPKVKVVTTDTQKFNLKEDKRFVNELLSAYPALKAIWTNAGYDNAIFGIVEQYNDPTKYPKLKCGDYKDGFYIWKDRLVDYPKFDCVSVSNPPGIAYDAAYAAFLMASGSEINESALGGEFGNAFIVDFPVITNENLLTELEKIQYEKSDHVVDQLMNPDEIKNNWFK